MRTGMREHTRNPGKWEAREGDSKVRGSPGVPVEILNIKTEHLNRMPIK